MRLLCKNDLERVTLSDDISTLKQSIKDFIFVFWTHQTEQNPDTLATPMRTTERPTSMSPKTHATTTGAILQGSRFARPAKNILILLRIRYHLLRLAAACVGVLLSSFEINEPVRCPGSRVVLGRPSLKVIRIR